MKPSQTPRKTTIKRELFQSSAVLAALIVLVFGAFLSALLYSSEFARANNAIKQTNNAVVIFIEGYFSEIINTIKVLDANVEVRNAASLEAAAHRRVLDTYRSITQANKNISYIYSGYEIGLMLINDWTPPKGYELTPRPWYVAAMASKPEISIGLPYQEIVSKEWLISTSKALRQADGAYRGVVAVDCTIDQIAHLIAQQRDYKTELSFVLDKSGKIILHPDQTLIGQSFEATYQQVEGNFFSYSRNVPLCGWTVVTIVQKDEILGPILFQVLTLIGLIGVIAILLGLVQSILLSRKLSRPIVELGKKIRGIIAGSFAEPAGYVYPNNEIGSMALEIGQLTEKELNTKAAELQEINNNLMESIHYARRLQNAILPNLQNKLGLAQGTSFSIWKPRNTVGGDMFWCKSDGRHKLVAVADCTGHGVPGALMTMALSSILDSAVRETGLASPAQTLHLVNERLKHNLMQNNEDSQILDGADIALLLVDTEEKQLVFAGAGLSLFLVAEGKVAEHKGAKAGVGFSFGKPAEYAETVLPYRSGDRCYFTTDGFLDQHRDDDKIGLGKKGFISLLERMADLPMLEQQVALESEIQARLKNVHQRDDITIVGLEL